MSTYNRAHWLAHTLPLILQHAAPYGDFVEVVVCDNTSTDDTPAVVAALRRQYEFRSVRNPVNVGMLGNLGVCSNNAQGEYVWVVGDDDLIVDGAIARVLSAVASHVNVELLYLNYAYTNFDQPGEIDDCARVIRNARAISLAIRDEYAERLSRIATKSENCFTAIYCIIYRRDHAKRVYNQDTSGPPFSSLLTSVPTADYTCRVLFDRPAYWVGDPSLVVNMNVSWLRYASLFMLENFPELFDLMQEKGADPVEVDVLRTNHLPGLLEWLPKIYVAPHRDNLRYFSMARLVRRFGHVPAFREQWPALRKIYRRAFIRRQTEDATLTPERLDTILASETRK